MRKTRVEMRKLLRDEQEESAWERGSGEKSGCGGYKEPLA